MENLERKELPEDMRIVLPQLETLDFIKEKRNIVLTGNPGTGKTHIATGLGIKACKQGIEYSLQPFTNYLLKYEKAVQRKP